ncbi:predicted protein [Phaeodactylum tricornutum CCAP 1055/1]|jgi:hypothetical protein|uniref:Transcriptional coactivator p15 (PC4) C-terminal domain-containing protein n=2 Tax=Phaeodactylum tricornutum TaxID=2850 RepID=B7G292_PHATC|nr:predicted protein [Phaeodactylum tricornutum CCAP 1055/1]EEC47261.1 predicted protein [Phaeodactylum tricornutum CCAP 1055/1]|eukprot:XP_002181338.1 predicted protein [Phaeodactylum tricornutum CCAP 1055/1]
MATEEPKQKKIKRTSHEVEEEEEEERTEVATYPTDAPDFSSTIRINEEGDSFFELSKTRRVTVRQFKGTTLVDIREYYEKGDKLMPGKKGISLTLDQFNEFKDVIQSGLVDKALKKLE